MPICGLGRIKPDCFWAEPVGNASIKNQDTYCFNIASNVLKEQALRAVMRLTACVRISLFLTEYKQL